MTQFLSQYLDPTWAGFITAAVTAAEGDPVFLPEVAERSWGEILEGISGVVVIGHDCAPRRSITDAEALCTWCHDHSMPYLGIDHGLHILNCSHGGTLHNDLPRDLPDALQHRHPPERGLRHAINVLADTCLADLYGDQATRLLTVQYRMHEAIMNFSSQEFYACELEAAPAVREHRLCELPGVRSEALTQEPLHFIDTAGAGFDEQREPAGESLSNPDETRLVCGQVQGLLAAGLSPGDLAVIAPYSAQVRLLRESLGIAGLEIDSVDGFQGREKEAVVISLVRSNTEGDIGFLADVRRMNVALTRARRKLLVIGDSATLAVHPFYQELFAYFETIDAYGTVWEEQEY